jgi:site-specific DNA recombinase
VEPVIALYARASLDKTERRISVERQIDRCKALAADALPGREVVVYQDNNRSGSDPGVARPGYEALIAAIRRGAVAELVVHEQSRLTRRPEQWEELVVTLSLAGLERVWTVQQGQIPVSAGTRLLGRILAVVDAEESERIKLRATAMAQQLAQEGRPQGGRFYGYRRVTGDDRRPHLVIDTAEAAVVRRICSELAVGRSSYQVAEGLNRDGVPTARKGTKWRDNAVLQLVRRPHIAGLRSYNGSVVGPGRWEPIIPPEEWRNLQSSLSARVRQGGGARPRRWLLTGGLAVCGLCKAPLTTTKHPRPWGTITGYSCSVRSHFAGHKPCGKITVSPAELVEAVVVAGALAALDTPAVRAALAESSDPHTERVALMTRMTKAESRVKRAAELYGSGEVDEETWRAMHAPAARTVADCLAALAKLETPDPGLPAVEQLREKWDALTLAQRQGVLRLVIQRVVVGPQVTRAADPIQRISDRLTIEWK